MIRFKHLANIGGLSATAFTLIGAKAYRDKEGVEHPFNVSAAHFAKLWELRDKVEQVTLIAHCHITKERVSFQAPIADIFYANA